MKRGDKITMFLHGTIITTKETHKIIDIKENVISIDELQNGRKFDRKTGKCLNDNNFCGFYRTIDPV